MTIKYQEAEDLRQIANQIAIKLGLNHINLGEVAFLRSYGSRSRRCIARCHALSKPLQLGLKRKGFYLVEVISERFDSLDEKDKIKTIIHELMHIPKCFGGGFRHHDFVCNKNVNLLYGKFCEK